MDGLMAASLLKMFLSVCEKGPGAIVPELISLSIPGSDILLAAEIMGVDLSSNSAVRRDPSLQRYLNINLDRSIDRGGLDRTVTRRLDNE
jgi:hypothetical protein